MGNQYYAVIRSPDSLMHFGILGQKWGLRRWQYSDGSLTPEGRNHYGVGPARGIPKEEARQRIADYNKTHGTRISPRKAIIKKGKYYYDGNGRRLHTDDLNMRPNSVKEVNPITSKTKVKDLPDSFDNMTLAELKEKAERLEAENRYKRAYEQRYPKPIKKSNYIAEKVVIPAATKVASQGAEYMFGTTLNSVMGNEIWKPGGNGKRNKNRNKGH